MIEPERNVFRYCPRCAAENPSAGGNPFQCEACGFTHYFSPISAVGAIIEDSDRRVLFIRRGKDPGKGKRALHQIAAVTVVPDQQVVA